MKLAKNKFVSIPAWCDWELENLLQKIDKTLVSIPAWCDWEQLPEPDIITMLTFQFQLGAIGRYFLSIVNIC